MRIKRSAAAKLARSTRRRRSAPEQADGKRTRSWRTRRGKITPPAAAAAAHPLAALGDAMVGAVHTAASFEARSAASPPPRAHLPPTPSSSLRARGMLDDFKRILAGAGTDLAAMRRRVTRLLRDDLDILESFHHLTRHDRPPVVAVGSRGSIRRRERSSRPTAIARPPPASGASQVMGLGLRLRPTRPPPMVSSSSTAAPLRRRRGLRGCAMASTGSWTGASACSSETTGDSSGTTPRKDRADGTRGRPPRSHMKRWRTGCSSCMRRRGPRWGRLECIDRARTRSGPALTRAGRPASLVPRGVCSDAPRPPERAMLSTPDERRA